MVSKRPSASRKRVALVVLGMHRGGTSALSGVMAQLGAQAPRSPMEPTGDNPKGYFESSVIKSLNDRILRSAGSRWNDWGRFNPDWQDAAVAEEHREAIGEAIDSEFGQSPLILLKDPRICRLFPVWREVLQAKSIDPRVVFPVRHPLEVAASLEKRDHFGRNRSLLLWLRHVLDAEASSRGLPRAFVTYHALLDDWRQVANRLSDELGFKWPRISGDSEAAIAGFLSTDLRHHQADSQAIPGGTELHVWVNDTVRILRGFASSSKVPAPGDLDRLDEIRAEFNRTSDVYAGVVREHENRVQALYAEKKEQLREARESLGEAREAQMAGDSRITGMQEVIDRQVLQIAEMDRSHTSGTLALMERIERLEGEQARERELWEARLAEAREANQTLQERFRSEQVLEREGWEARLAEAHQTNETLRERLDADADETLKLREELRALVRKVHDFDAASLEHVIALAERDQKLEALGTEKDRLAETLEETQGQVGALKASLKVVEGTVEERFAEVARLSKMVLDLEQAIQTHREQSQARELELAGARDRAEHLLEFTRSHHAKSLTGLERNFRAWRSAAEKLDAFARLVISSRRWKLVKPFGSPPPAAPEIPDPVRSYYLSHQLHVIGTSSLFDAQWYRERHPDVGARDPALHYATLGAAMGLDPGPDFSTVGYLLRYEDVRKSGVNPLVHFMEHGQQEGRTSRDPGRQGE